MVEQKYLRLLPLLLAANFCTVAQVAESTPVGITDTENISADADLIVAAVTTKVVSRGAPAYPGGRADNAIQLRVEKTLKNTSATPSPGELTFYSRQASDVSGAKRRNFRGIFFLKRDKTGNLLPMDEQHLAVPLSPDSDCSMAPSQPVVDVIACEMAKVLNTPAEKFNTEKQPVGRGEDAYKVFFVIDQASWFYDNAVDALAHLPARYAVPYLVKVSKSENQRSRLRAVQALARLRNFEQLSSVESILMAPPKPLYHEVGLLSYYMNIEDAKYASILKRLTKSKDHRIRKVAQESLNDLSKAP